MNLFLQLSRALAIAGALLYAILLVVTVPLSLQFVVLAVALTKLIDVRNGKPWRDTASQGKQFVVGTALICVLTIGIGGFQFGAFRSNIAETSGDAQIVTALIAGSVLLALLTVVTYQKARQTAGA